MHCRSYVYTSNWNRSIIIESALANGHQWRGDTCLNGIYKGPRRWKSHANHFS
jgi:hypothetical protein